MKKIYPRWQKKQISQAIDTRRVLLLCGARQCGKTTLAKEIADKNTSFRTLDDLALRQLAEIDPKDFVRTNAKLQIIDEIQRVPELLSAIKQVVDENSRPGQYLLTGSANIQSLPNAYESLAGRIRKIRLRPLTQGEIVLSKPDFLNKAFNKSFSNAKNKYDRRSMIDIAFRGGFPEAISLDERERVLWHRDYMMAILERDLNEITKISKHQAMQELVHILAAWSGKLMVISSIGSTLGIQRPTLESYINALEILYLIDRVPPWIRTDYERVGKQSKLYLCDTGLMTSILKWHKEQVEMDGDRSGKLIETFIYNELAAQIDASVGQYELFHYRDREKREIDFIIERDDQTLLGIEVKSGSSISTADFKHLKWFKESIAKQPFIGIVLYAGEAVGSMGDGMFAVPFGELWD